MSVRKTVKFTPKSGNKIILTQNSKGVFEISPEDFQRLKIKVPQPIADRYSIVGYQDPVSDRLVVGLSKDVVQGKMKLTSVDEVKKFKNAKYILKNAYEEVEIEKKTARHISLLTHYDNEKILNSVDENSRNKILVLERYLNRLQANYEVINSNQCDDGFSKEIKALSLRSITDIINYIRNNMMDLLKSYDVSKFLDIKGIPSFIVKFFTINVIQVKSKLDNLRNLFFSKNNPGPIMSLNELLNDEITNYLGEKFIGRSKLYASLIKMMVEDHIVDDPDFKKDVLEMKVNVIPSDSFALFNARIPPMKLMRKFNKVVNAVNILNWAFRLTYADPVKDALALSHLLKDEKSKQVVLRKGIASGIKEGSIKIDDKEYLKLVKLFVETVLVSYGFEKKPYMKVFRDKPEFKKVEPIKEFKMLDQTILKKRFDELNGMDAIKELFMKNKKMKPPKMIGLLSNEMKRKISKLVDSYPLFKGTKMKIATFLSGFKDPVIRNLALAEIGLSMENMTIDYEFKKNSGKYAEIDMQVFVLPTDEVEEKRPLSGKEEQSSQDEVDEELDEVIEQEPLEFESKELLNQ